MRLLARFGLAIVVLIAQMGSGLAECRCDRGADATTAVSASAPRCPMTGVPGCTCCSADSKADQGAAKKSASGCQMASGHAETGALCALLAGIELPVAADPFVVAIFWGIEPGRDALPPHPVWPRVRPPDIGANGLRAPPSR